MRRGRRGIRSQSGRGRRDRTLLRRKIGRAGLAYLPDGGSTAALAITKDAIVGGAHVGFRAGVIDLVDGLTGDAYQREEAELPFDRRWRRKIHFPEIRDVIGKGDSVGIDAAVFADLPNDTDVRFFVALRPAKNEFLFGRKLVPGKKAGAVKAEQNGFGMLGKNPAAQIGTDEKDGNFFGDASASAHNLQWQRECQREFAEGTI